MVYKGSLIVSDPLFRNVTSATVNANKANNNIVFQYFSNSREGVYGVEFTAAFVISGPSTYMWSAIAGSTSCMNELLLLLLFTFLNILFVLSWY